MGSQGLHQRVIILAGLLRKRSVDPAKRSQKLFLILPRLGPDRFNQYLQFSMGGIHLRIDLRQGFADPGKVFHDFFHAQAVGSVHIREKLSYSALRGRDVSLYLIQLPGKQAHLFIDISVGLFIPAAVLCFRFFKPLLIRGLHFIQQGRQPALRLLQKRGKRLLRLFQQCDKFRPRLLQLSGKLFLGFLQLSGKLLLGFLQPPGKFFLGVLFIRLQLCQHGRKPLVQPVRLIPQI